MMEKPPGLSVVETTELRDAAVAAGVKGMVAWNRRFHPIIAKAREMVLERGPITQVLGEFHKDMRSFIDENIAGANMSSGRLMRGEGRKREWFDGEEWHLGFPPHILDKMFMESPVHALDVVRAMGGDVEESHAFSRRSFTQYRDVHTVSMLHTNGCISTVIANYTQPEGNRLERYEIHGHGITAHLEGVNQGWVMVDGMGRDERIDISDSVGAGDGGTTEQLRYFTDAVLSDSPIALPAANFEEAIKTMTVAEETLNASPDTLSTQLKVS
jgi:predicted dehydrogenase